MEDEKREPTTTELLNKLKLLESTLKFYADENNYGENENSQINRDKGYMARYALGELKNIAEYESSLYNDIKKITSQMEEIGIVDNSDFDSEQIKNFINQLKQLSNS